MRRKIALLVSVSFIIVMGISIDSFSFGQMAKYVGTDTCKMCHWKQYRSWAKTKMAKTFQDTLNGEQREDPECIVCHSTGYKKPGGFVNVKTTPQMAGVQCEACHGAGSLYYTDGIMRNRYASMQLGMLEQNEKVCVTCHNEKNPFFPGPFKFDKDKGVHEHFPMSEWFKKHQYDR
jgi:hypothetical protein